MWASWFSFEDQGMLKVWDVGGNLLVDIITSVMFLFDLFWLWWRLVLLLVKPCIHFQIADMIYGCQAEAKKQRRWSSQRSAWTFACFFWIQLWYESWNALNIIPSQVFFFLTKIKDACHITCTSLINHQNPPIPISFIWSFLPLRSPGPV